MLLAQPCLLMGSHQKSERGVIPCGGVVHLARKYLGVLPPGDLTS